MAEGAIPVTKNNKVAVNSVDPAPGFLVDKLDSPDGSVTIEADSCNCKVNLTTNGPGGFTEKWIKTTVDYTDFNTASTTVDIVPGDFSGLGAGAFYSGYKIKHRTSFSGGGVFSATMQILFTPSVSSSSIDVTTAVSDTNDVSGTVPSSSGTDQASTNDVTVRLFMIGDTGDNLATGEADLWIKVTDLT